MKKNKLLIVIVFILAAVSAWLYMNKKSSTINKELRDFAVKDTAAVTRIFMANKKGQQVLLERQSDGEWMLNNKHWARPDGIRTLLQTMHDIEVRSPVAKAAYNNIIKSMATKGIKVEIYTDDGLLKTYYVGGPSMDQMGTFMYLESSSVPFVIHIPGFDGYLTPRYICDENDWIVKNVFRLREGNLKSLTLINREIEDYSFSISKNADAPDYVVRDKNGIAMDNISQDKVISYLQFYATLNYEGKEKSLSSFQLDSLKATAPFCTITLENQQNETSRVDLWRRPITTQTVNKAMEDGTPFRFDVDRMTASVNGDTSLVVVQYFSFGKLLKSPADLLISNTTK